MAKRRGSESFGRGGRKAERHSVESLSEEGLEMLKNFMQEMVEYYEDLGLPLTEDGQVDINRFRRSEQHDEGEIDDDVAYVQSLQEIFALREAENLPHQKIFKRLSELSEKIIPVIFYKSFKAHGFHLFRTSPYDDFKNGIDFPIIHKKSGRVICSFDATTSNEDGILLKLDKVRTRNMLGGAKVKYAPTLGEGGKFHLGSIDGSDGSPPLVHLSISREKIFEFINDLATTTLDIDDYCDGFFDDLILSMYQSFETIKVNIPEQAENIDELTEILREETGIDPSLAM